MQFRQATSSDANLLAPLNAQLIQDEGHRNAMTVPQLAERMAGWLQTDYTAVIVEEHDEAIAYALYRRESDYVYLRQLFVRRDHRRQGIGRQLMAWLWQNVWQGAPRLRIDVLVGNTAAQDFWRSVGFKDYCITMEMQPPTSP